MLLFVCPLIFGCLWLDFQAAWIVDESDEEDSDNGDSDDDGMVLDRGEDHYSNQDQDFEDDKETLILRDNETQNDSEMMVSIFSIYFGDLQVTNHNL